MHLDLHSDFSFCFRCDSGSVQAAYRAESENARLVIENGIDLRDERLVRAIRLWHPVPRRVGDSNESWSHVVLGAGN